MNLYFRTKPFVPVLIGVVVIHQFSLNRNFTTLCQVFLGNIGNFPPRNHIVPLSFCYLFALCIAITFIGSDLKAY